MDTIKFANSFFATMAKQRIEKMIRGKKISLDPLELKNAGDVLGEHISIIMLWSPVGAMFLKIHFDLNAAKQMAAGGLERSLEDVSKEMAFDFMKECSNGVGGFVRSLFEKNQLLMGMSLPFLADGRDEVIFRKIRDPRSVASNWDLKLDGGGSFRYTAEVCLLEPKSIEKIRPQLEAAMSEGDKAESKEGEVEFLF